MPIRRLSALLINQIAAGEVIERPASVVKELVENALDAGARRIDVLIEDGGRELIRVADDGGGIPAAELPLALEPHATSKIDKPQDLESIATLGFRGEALASIASVSRLKLASRTPDSPAGSLIEAGGDRMSPVAPVGCAPGTVLEVRNLFFNTPARRKFMRTAPTEFSHIHDALARIAMAHPAVGFRFTHSGRVILDLPPGQTPRQRCIAILGSELEEGLMEVDSNERGIGIWGLIGAPALARPTARCQYLYVNHRPIRDRNVAHALKEAYRGLIEPTAQPAAVLFLTIDPRMVDVNVHPTKSEVRFVDSNAIHGQVLATLRQRLLGADLTPTIAVRSASLALDLQPVIPGGGDGAAVSGPVIHTATDFVDYFKQMDPHQKGFVYEQVRREMARPEEADQAELRMGPAALPQSILQVHNSYIVTQDDQGIVIIDQHALHERMMFQELLDRITSSGKLESQRLITPVMLPANPARIQTLARIQPLLERIGIEAGPMGPATIAIQAFATLLFDRNVDPVEFMNGLLDRAEERPVAPDSEEALHEVLDMMSCKAAVKAGDNLAPGELSALLHRRDQIERASNCPHGRPTAIRLSLSELEKHFKRG